jgi:hypothetical protein
MAGLVMTTGDEYEAALRSLPEAHSLALRLRDAGVADEVICGYLRIEQESLGTLLDLARLKLDSAIHTRRGTS